jgi:hypothetical protein
VCCFARPSHPARRNTKATKERRIDPVIARLCESASSRVVGSLGLCLLLLLAAPGGLAAQDSASRLFPVPTDYGWPEPSEAASLPRSSPVYRLLPDESPDPVAWMASDDIGTDSPLKLGRSPQRRTATGVASADATAFAGPTMDALPRLEQDEPELPRWAFLERHRLLVSTLIPITGLAAVTANSLIGYDTDRGFRFHREGWFGRNTTNGGADKASHLTDYFIIANLFEDVYRILGYSENAAILWGFGMALATGLANEVSDGFTLHGFSWEDLAMDAAGATAASLVSVTRTKDLLGMRTSHLPGSTYTHDVYSADLKLSGLGQRLGVNIGPLRWLLLSVTYGTKGYRVEPRIAQQRQVGLEIGLNLQQILNDLGVKRNTWWGYSLHLIGDNVRFPFTAVGVRVDLNRGKWHGPNSGNYD